MTPGSHPFFKMIKCFLHSFVNISPNCPASKESTASSNSLAKKFQSFALYHLNNWSIPLLCQAINSKVLSSINPSVLSTFSLIFLLLSFFFASNF